MKLYLQVISKDRYYLGDKADYTFGQGGGTIGRSTSADWVIEDSGRFMSGFHLLIEGLHDGFYITDQSTNGTFRGSRRLDPGVRDAQPLQVNDEICLGQVKIKVFDLELSNPGLGVSPESTYLRHDELFDEAQDQGLLEHQARLADVIAKSFPEVDHGQELRALIPEEPQLVMPAPVHVTVDPPAPANATTPTDPLPEEMLELVLRQVLIKVQQQLAKDRFTLPLHFQSLGAHNMYRTACSVCEIKAYDLKRLKADTQEALDYLLRADPEDEA